MKKEELLLKSFVDENPISVMVMYPENEPKGILQIVHGMVEHKERYENFMEFIAKQGYIVIIADTRGHGASVRNSNDLGYFYDNGDKSIIEDTHQVSLYIKDKYPELDLILFGHSMGSLIVRNYIKSYSKDVAKLIVCGSPSYNSGLDFGLKLIRIIEKFKGSRHRSQFIKNLSFQGFNKGFKGNNPNRWVCANEDVVNSYSIDPLCNYTFTLNAYESLFNLMKNAYSKEGWTVTNPEMPILFISGKDDRTFITYDKWIEAQELLKTIGYTNISNKLYDNCRHEILNEKNNDEIYLDIIEFINN